MKFLCFITFTTIVATAQAAEPFGVYRHMARGSQCLFCDGPDLNNVEYPTIETCEQCYDVKALVAKTVGIKPKRKHCFGLVFPAVIQVW